MTAPVQQYDERANSPGAWWWFGKNLLLAADVLYRHAKDSTSSMRLEVALHGPTLMLRASGIECMLKALALDAGERFATGGRLDGSVRTHDLVHLSRRIRLSFEAEEVAVLAKLQGFVTGGRYPVEWNWQLTYQPKALDAHYAWTASDEVVWERLRLRICHDDERMSALQ